MIHGPSIPDIILYSSNAFSRPFQPQRCTRKGSLAEKGKIVGTLVEIESKGEPRQGGGVSLSLSSLSGIFFNQLDSIILEYSTFCALR